MNKLIVLLGILLAVSGCSFVKDVQSHCQIETTSVDATNGSFKTCLTCDSLAKIVKTQIAKAQVK